MVAPSDPGRTDHWYQLTGKNMKISQQYSGLQKLLHWAIVLGFAFNYVVSDGMGKALRAFNQTGVNDILTAKLHVIVGVSILALMVVRILLRFVQGAPALPAGGHAMMDKLAHIVHGTLYVVMLAVPASGAAAWFKGVKIAGDAHEVLVNLAIILVLAHVAAALFHHFVLKDGLLNRMRPGAH